MTLDLTTKNKWVIIKGYGYNSPGKFKNKYTIADLRKQDYNLYKKLEKVFLY